MADQSWTALLPASDSIYWNITAPDTAWCYDSGVWYVAGRYDATSKYGVIQSTDLLTWTLVTDEPAFDPAGGDYSTTDMPGLEVFDGDLYYFPQADGDPPGDGEGVYKSEDDGETWTRIASPLDGDQPMGAARTVVWRNRLWLLLGLRGSSDPYDRSAVAELWVTSDGSTWTLNDEWSTSAEGSLGTTTAAKALFVGPDDTLCMYHEREVGDGSTYPSLGVYDEGQGTWSWTSLSMADDEDVSTATLRSGTCHGGGVYHNGVYYVCLQWTTTVGSVVTYHDRVLYSDDGSTMSVFESDPAWDGSGRRVQDILVADGTLYIRLNGSLYLSGHASYSLYVGSGEGVELGEASESEWYNFACTPYGSVLDRDSVSYDFNRLLIFDLRHGVIYPGVGYPFSCTLSSTSPCAGSGMLPSSRFGGTIDGYVHEILDDTAWGLGAPAGLVAWPLAAGCTTTTLYIDLATAQQHFPTDALIGLTVYVGDESATVSDNDTTSVTLGSALSSAPSAGDTLLVAPMTCGLIWPEDRSADVHTPFRLALQVENDQQYGDGTKIEQDFNLDIWAAQDGVIDLDLGSPTETYAFDTTDLRQGKGYVYFPRHTARASTIGLRFQPVGNGRLRVGKASLGIVASAGEEGRGS